MNNNEENITPNEEQIINNEEPVIEAKEVEELKIEPVEAQPIVEPTIEEQPQTETIEEPQPEIKQPQEETQNNNQPENNVETQTPPAKKSHKILFIIIGVVAGLFVLSIVAIVLLLVVFTSSSSNLECKSKEGNITIFYNDNTLTGYTISGKITYDFDGQKAIAEKIGTGKYVQEFNEWFATNTSGTCTNTKK